MTSRAIAVWAWAGASMLLVVGTARADWLVLRDGSRVETQGPWEVRRGLVVFETAKGALSSIRLDEVDLDASRTATAEAQKAAESKSEAPPPEKRREPVATITNDDVGGEVEPVEPAPSPAAPPADSTAAPAPAPSASVVVPAGGLVIPVDPPFSVSAVRRTETKDGGVTIRGTLRLTGGSDNVEVLWARLVVEDSEGVERDSALLELAGRRLPPGAGTSFKVSLPRDPGDDRLRIEVEVEKGEG